MSNKALTELKNILGIVPDSPNNKNVLLRSSYIPHGNGNHKTYRFELINLEIPDTDYQDEEDSDIGIKHVHITVNVRG